ncbi:MAG: hypothetical protein CL961_04720, partial [Euryarchaeota archaeon]|nr:hypothetical protein [Euryarchaeota archaeon]
MKIIEVLPFLNTLFEYCNIRNHNKLSFTGIFVAEMYETSIKKYFHEKNLTTNFRLKKTVKQKILTVLSISLLLLCYLPESSAQTQNIESDNNLSKQFLTSNTLQNSQLFSFTDIDLAIDTDNKNHIITVDNYSLIYNTF